MDKVEHEILFRFLHQSWELNDPQMPWMEIEAEDWNGGGKREVEVYSETCAWHKSGHRPVLIHWVSVGDSQGEYEPKAL